jgi:hypothetical protein
MLIGGIVMIMDAVFRGGIAFQSPGGLECIYNHQTHLRSIPFFPARLAMRWMPIESSGVFNIQ